MSGSNNLPAFYWHPQVLTGLLSAAGKVIKLDGNTMSGMVGQYIRALVEVDLDQQLLETVKVGCGESSFLVELVYENLPYFCSHCKIVGHSVDRCHRNKEKKETVQAKTGVDDGRDKGVMRTKPQDLEQWQVKTDRRKRHISTAPQEKEASHNRFDVLAKELEDPVEPTAVDLLERVTVPVENEAAEHRGGPQVVVQGDQRMVNLERRMQAGKIIDAVVQELTSKQTGKSTTDGMSIINEKLQQASALGATPTDFEVTPRGNVEFVVMDRVGRRNWADEVDLESEDEENSGGFPPENLARSP